MKKFLIVSLVFLIVGSISTVLFYNNKKLVHKDPRDFDTKIIENKKETSDEKTLVDEEKEVIDEVVENETITTPTHKETSKEIIKDKTTSNKSNTTKEEIIIPKEKEESRNEIVNNENKDEVDAETPQTENKKYIGVPNPNDFYYSFHNGKIDDAYTTLEGCYNKSIEVNFLDTVDIINSTCYEVLDENNTVLGIYMQVKCNSGNCEKYKKQVGINTN